MPQLDFATFPGQIFWLLVLFITLYVLVARNILPKISSVIEDRNKHIADDLDKAEDMKNKSEEVEDKATAKLYKSTNDAKVIIDESRERIEMVVQEKRIQAAKKLDKTLAQAEAKIANIESESDRVIKRISQDISGIISQKLVA